MSSVPSDEEFARAERLDKERSRNLDEVRRAVLQHFASICPLVTLHIMPQRDVDFRVYVFFKEDKDIETCKSNGVLEAITDCVYEEIERAGRGKRADIAIAFELDSDENVEANYEGNYYLRLRQ